MRRTPWLLVATLVLAAGALPAAAAAKTRIVDDDGKARPGDCGSSQAASRTIQKAVTKSVAGDVILVCPGSYRERVTVGGTKDRLVIRSTKLHKAIVRLPATVVAAESLLTIDVGASKVRIERLMFRHVAPVEESVGSCGLEAAIVVLGTQATVDAVRIQGEGGGSLGACALEVGVRLGPGDPVSATVKESVIKDVSQAGISAFGDGVRLSALDNTIRAHHLDAEVTSVSPRGTGIVFDEGAGGDARRNVIESHPTAGPLVEADNVHFNNGIDIVASDAPITVRGNTIRRAYNAIRVLDDFGPVDPVSALIRGNTTSGSYNGVFVDGGDPRVIENTNTANRYGIFVRNPTAGAVFTDNSSSGSEQTDCVDQTTGAGTAGTANTWTGNTGATANPGAICD
jgi:hypothetical protein